MSMKPWLRLCLRTLLSLLPLLPLLPLFSLLVLRTLLGFDDFTPLIFFFLILDTCHVN